jgi:hypothetical protein
VREEVADACFLSLGEVAEAPEGPRDSRERAVEWVEPLSFAGVGEIFFVISLAASMILNFVISFVSSIFFFSASILCMIFFSLASRFSF